MNIKQYCKTMSQMDSLHIDDCRDNLRYIENNEIDKMIGCPSAFGLDRYLGLCEFEEVAEGKQDEQCKLCWEKALQEQTQ